MRVRMGLRVRVPAGPSVPGRAGGGTEVRRVTRVGPGRAGEGVAPGGAGAGPAGEGGAADQTVSASRLIAASGIGSQPGRCRAS